MKPASQKPVELATCDRCGGVGFEAAGRACRRCRGLAWGLPFGRFFLYWGRRVDSFALRVDRAQRAIDFITDAILLVAGLGGLALLALTARQAPPRDLLALPFWHAPHRYLLGFWWGALALLVFWYRRLVAAARSEAVRWRGYGEDVQPTAWAGDTWNGALRLPRSARVDVSRAFSPAAAKVVDGAFHYAKNFSHAEVTPVDLFAAALGSVQASVIFGRLGLKYEKFKDKLARLMALQPPGAGEPAFAPATRGLLLGAYVEAYGRKQPAVEPTELLLGAVRADERLQEILYDHGVDLVKMENVASWIRIQELVRRRFRRFTSAAKLKPKSGMNRAMTAVATPMLDRVSRDLTISAAYGHFLPIVDREVEFEAVFRAIEGGRRSVVLVGQPGVGKMAIVEGLAQRMVEEDVPEILQDKRLVSLNVAEIVSGATAAEAQERLLLALAEVARSGNIVLIIEGVAGMVGIAAGAGSESLDLARVLADELGRGYCFAICTATPREYAEALEGGPLGNVLTKVEIPEVEVNQAIQILEAKLGLIEYRHHVWFSYDAVEAAVTLADRYLHEQFLPEKAIQLAKEAAATVQHRKGRDAIVDREAIATVVAEKTKIPVKSLTEQESQKLLNLEQAMHGRVIGQDEAVQAVAAAMRRGRAELRETNRPIANFLFLGPTGVGKTELAKTLAAAYFGDEEAMIRLDMSEYQDKASLYRLIGEPAGSQSGGLLTEAVRRRPFALVLLDEIEKANPDILNVFLQVMDDGRLTDNVGRVIDFTNVILIATSNAGAPFIQDEIRAQRPIAAIKEALVGRELRQSFRPEFLNRFDDIIVFAPLTPDQIVEITRLMLKKVAARLEERGIVFEATEPAIRELAAAGYDPAFGARPLRRVIQDKVDNVVAEALLKGKLGRRDKLIFDQGGSLRVEKAARL